MIGDTGHRDTDTHNSGKSRIRDFIASGQQEKRATSRHRLSHMATCVCVMAVCVVLPALAPLAAASTPEGRFASSNPNSALGVERASAYLATPTSSAVPDPAIAYPAPGDIATIAGDGTACPSPPTSVCGDRGPATSAQLNSPDGVALSPSGNILIADTYDNRIRMIAVTSCPTTSSPCPYGFSSSMTAGNLYTVAGTGQSFSYPSGGDGGKAIYASLTYPFSVTADGAGNIYIADTGDNAIRRVDVNTGIITTVAGNGTACPSPSTSTCGDGGPAIDAELNFPVSLAVGPHGDLYIADTLDNRIREVATYAHTQWGIPMQAGYIYTIIATGAMCPSPTNTCGDGGPAANASLKSPIGLAFGPHGDLYIVDSGDERIREVATYAHTQWGIPMQAGYIYTVAGNGEKTYAGDGGPATSASLDVPHGVAVDSAGNLYITEFDNRIREVASTSGNQWGIPMQAGYIYTVIGNGTACADPTATPACGDGGPVSSANLTNPFGIAIGPKGHIYIADSHDNRIRVATPSTPVPGPSPTSLGTGPSGAANVNVCETPDVVVCSSGDLNEHETDFSIPGFNGGLTLTRTYNSIDASLKGPFGYGWSSSASMSLSVNQANGFVTVTQPGGSQVTFAPLSGGYKAAGFVLATLSHNANGTWTFTRKGRQIFTFSPAGLLIATSDPNGSTTTYAYGPTGELSSITDPSGRSLIFSYGSLGLVSKVTGPGGESVSYGYDAVGNLTSVTDPLGDTTRFSYNASHLLTSLTDPNGDTTTNVYDSTGQVIAQTDPAGGVTTFSYAGNPFSATGSTTTITYPDGNVEIQRYEEGALVSDTLGAGTSSAATWIYTINPTTLETTSVTDPDGHVTGFSYDAQGNVTVATNPLGATTRATYNSFDEPLTITNAEGTTTTDTYDASGDLISTSTPVGAATSTTTFVHANLAHPGEITSIINPDGAVWHLGYDAYGDLSSITNPLGDTTSYTYNVLGEKTSSTAPRGGVTKYIYDAAGKLIGEVNPLGAETTYAYDADGQLVSTTNPLGDTTSYRYSPLGQLIATVLPNGTTTTSTYDGNGNLVAQTNALGERTTYTYNALNRLVSTTNPLGDTTSYSYDPVGNLTEILNPAGVTTNLGYDAANQVTSITYSDGTSPASYAYDPLGHLISMTGANGTSTYVYDALGHLVKSTDGAGASLSYTYDLAGNLVSLTYPNGKTVTNTYNAAGQLASTTDWLGNTTSYTYGPDGNLDSETLGNGIKGTFTTNTAGEMTSLAYYAPCPSASSKPPITPPGGPPAALHRQAPSCQPIYARSYSYDAASLLSTSSSPIGMPPGLSGGTSYGYNQLSELVSTAPTAPSAPVPPGLPSSALPMEPPLPRTTYAYNAAGSLNGVSSANGSSLTLGYNDGSELTTMDTSAPGPAGPSIGASFTYNASGERTGETLIPNAPQVPQPPSTSLLPLATLSYAYDAPGEMMSYAGPVGGSPLSVGGFTPVLGAARGMNLASEATASYTYDPSGLLASETATSSLPRGAGCKPPAPPKGHLGHLGPALSAPSPGRATANCTSSTTTAFTWDTAGSLPLAVGVGSYYYVYGPTGLPLEQIGSNRSVLYYLANRQGSTVALADTRGQVVARYAYSPYGSLLCGSGPLTSRGVASGCSPLSAPKPPGCPPGAAQPPNVLPGIEPCLSRAIAANHFYYDGQYLDAASGLYYLRARWYDPATAQFTSVDPLVAKTLQPYEYAGDDPVNGGDPSGMCECIAPSAGAAAAKGFAGLTLESLIANYIEAYTTNLLASSVNALFLGSQSVLMIADLSGYIQLLGELTTLNALVAATCGL